MSQAASAFQVTSKSRLPTLKEYLAKHEHAILQAHHRLCMATQKTGNDLENVIDEIAAQPFAPLVFALPGQIYAQSYMVDPTSVDCIATDFPDHLANMPIIFNPGWNAFCNKLRDKLKKYRAQVTNVVPKNLPQSSEWRDLCQVALMHHELRSRSFDAYFINKDHPREIRRATNGLGYRYSKDSDQPYQYASNMIIDRALSVPPIEQEGPQALCYLPRGKYPHLYERQEKDIKRPFVWEY